MILSPQGDARSQVWTSNQPKEDKRCSLYTEYYKQVIAESAELIRISRLIGDRRPHCELGNQKTGWPCQSNTCQVPRHAKILPYASLTSGTLNSEYPFIWQ